MSGRERQFLWRRADEGYKRVRRTDAERLDVGVDGRRPDRLGQVPDLERRLLDDGDGRLGGVARKVLRELRRERGLADGERDCAAEELGEAREAGRLAEEAHVVLELCRDGENAVLHDGSDADPEQDLVADDVARARADLDRVHEACADCARDGAEDKEVPVAAEDRDEATADDDREDRRKAESEDVDARLGGIVVANGLEVDGLRENRTVSIWRCPRQDYKELTM